MRSTFGPLRTFVPALAKVREIGTVGVRRAASAGAAHERAGTNVGKRPSTDSRFMRRAQHDAGRSR